MKTIYLVIESKYKTGGGSIATTETNIPDDFDWWDLVRLGFDLPNMADDHARGKRQGSLSISAISKADIEEVSLLGFFRTKEEAHKFRNDLILGTQ